MAEQPPYSPNVENQTVSYGGATWKGDPGTGWHLANTDSRDASYKAAASTTNAATGMDTESIIKNATALNDFYKKQNEPVIAATQATKAPLDQRYKDLLDSIRGNQQIAENRQTLTTNNELGRRGITGSSGLAQQELTNAVNPITQQYTSLQKDTTNQQNMDISAIDKAIAELTAGNPSNAVSTSTGIADAVTRANQFQQQLEANRQQNEIENAQKSQAMSMEQMKFDTNPYAWRS